MVCFVGDAGVMDADRVLLRVEREEEAGFEVEEEAAADLVVFRFFLGGML